MATPTTTTDYPPTTKTPPINTSNTSTNSACALNNEIISKFTDKFTQSNSNIVAQNAVSQVPVEDVALNRAVVCSIDHTFSNVLDEWEVTNQKKSGRCWMFAGLNLLRVGAMKKMNIKEFEFSQNYTLFWDKFERANYFLEAIISTAQREIDDRLVAYLLDHPLDDGGQWNMFVNIIAKHGLVPKSAMPETHSSSNTARMNALLNSKLLEGAKTIRDLASTGNSSDNNRAAALQKCKLEILEIIHRILCIHLGTPPVKFDWQWKDKDNNFQRDGEMTPKQFAAKYVTIPVENYVCLVHDPRPTSPVNHSFTVEFLGNVVGGDIVRYLNVETDLMKQLAMQAIENGEPVWFGCDVGKMMRRDLGLWDANLFDYANLYNTNFELTKADRLLYHDTFMTHAMLFTGVDVVDKQPRRWRVENSWGDENGSKGYFTMNDSWFEQYMFEIAVNKDSLPTDLQNAYKQDPIVLPAWDPMGSLAH